MLEFLVLVFQLGCLPCSGSTNLCLIILSLMLPLPWQVILALTADADAQVEACSMSGLSADVELLVLQ